MKTKYVRPTDKDHGHHDVFMDDGEHMGYLIINRSPFRAHGERWHFVGYGRFPNLHAENRKNLLETLSEFDKH